MATTEGRRHLVTEITPRWKSSELYLGLGHGDGEADSGHGTTIFYSTVAGAFRVSGATLENARSGSRRFQIPTTSTYDFRSAQLPPQTPPDDGFDPRRYRQPKKPIKLWMAYFNLLRSCFGAGMLAIPQATSHTGIVLGPIMTIFTGCLVMHSHYTLLWSLNEISRQLKIPYTSYRKGFRIALMHGPRCFQFIGKQGESIISLFIFLSQLGICCVFVIFTSDSLRDIMDWHSSKPAQYCLFLPYVLLEFFMRDLKIISIVSMLGNAMNFVGIIIVFYYLFEDPHGSDVAFYNTNLVHLMFAYGVMLFNISAIAVILAIDKSLENPFYLTKRCGILNIGIWIPTIVSACFGPAGYWAFGTMEDNILRSLPYDDNFAMAAIGLFLIAIVLAYPIQCHPGVDIALDVYKQYNVIGDDISNFHVKLAEAICRISFVLLCFFLCYLFPVQGPFVAFVGNLCTSLLVLVFPAMMELSILYPGPYGKYNFYLIKDITLIILGTLTSIVGVIQCGYLIYVRSLFMKINEEE